VTSTAKQFEIEEATKSGLKVEVDHTLTAPLPDVLASASSSGFAAFDDALASSAPGTNGLSRPPASRAAATMNVPMRGVTNGSGSFEHPVGRRAAMDSTAVIHEARRRRLLVIVASAAFAAVMGVVLLLTLGDNGTAAGTQGSATERSAPVVADAGSAAIEHGSAAPAVVPFVDAAVEEPTARAVDPATDVPVVNPVRTGACVVDIGGTAGVEIVDGDLVVGRTPTKLPLPCGVETKLTFRKTNFVPQRRTVTAAATGSRLRIALARPTLAVKVSSSPPGATVTVRGKSMGVTPTVVKLPAFTTTTLVISRPGFVAETHRLSPKQNNQTLHTSLKKKSQRF
jgi:hypothetical protein